MRLLRKNYNNIGKYMYIVHANQYTHISVCGIHIVDSKYGIKILWPCTLKNIIKGFVLAIIIKYWKNYDNRYNRLA